MELKHLRRPLPPSPAGLLIVPYGIETIVTTEGQMSLTCLLIVPYGIETHNLKTEILVYALF